MKMKKLNIGKKMKWWYDRYIKYSFFELLIYSWFSPFKNLKIYCRFGDIEHGHPYFFPRKWVNNKPVYYKWLGFDSNKLGWKTKWSNDDYRYEWSPSFSFIILKKQLFFILNPKDLETEYAYWETFLYYINCKQNAFFNTVKHNSNLYTQYHKGGEKIRGNYYYNILKKKWLKKYEKLKSKSISRNTC